MLPESEHTSVVRSSVARRPSRHTEGHDGEDAQPASSSIGGNASRVGRIAAAPVLLLPLPPLPGWAGVQLSGDMGGTPQHLGLSTSFSPGAARSGDGPGVAGAATSQSWWPGAGDASRGEEALSCPPQHRGKCQRLRVAAAARGGRGRCSDS